MEHENFRDALLNMEKWLMIMRQKLESFCSPSGQWNVEGRRHEAEVCVWVCGAYLRLRYLQTKQAVQGSPCIWVHLSKRHK